MSTHRLLDFIADGSKNKVALICNLDSLSLRCRENIHAPLPPLAESVARSLGLMDWNGNVLESKKLDLMTCIREYGPKLLGKKE